MGSGLSGKSWWRKVGESLRFTLTGHRPVPSYMISIRAHWSFKGRQNRVQKRIGNYSPPYTRGSELGAARWTCLLQQTLPPTANVASYSKRCLLQQTLPPTANVASYSKRCLLQQTLPPTANVASDNKRSTQPPRVIKKEAGRRPASKKTRLPPN